MNQLFQALQLGRLRLPNRIAMAPMTRARATRDGVPVPTMAEYYAQRASVGLLITEATAISRQGSGWPGAPGIYTAAHVEGWRAVTHAVHAAGGRIFLQLWHMGRVSHPDFQEGGALPVGPSAVAAAGETHTWEGKKPYVTPRALEASELSGIVQDYVAAAQNAVSAGFDGVEIHAANGYLLDQFLRDGANQRTDEFGGSVANRVRFPQMVMRAVAEAIGGDRTGIRFSPYGDYNDMRDSDPVATFRAAAAAARDAGLVYVHVMDPAGKPDPIHAEIKKQFEGAVIVNSGYTQETAEAVVATGAADIVAFGMLLLANPDLVARFEQGAPLNPPDFETLYGGGAKGYTDYPVLATR